VEEKEDTSTAAEPSQPVEEQSTEAAETPKEAEEEAQILDTASEAAEVNSTEPSLTSEEWRAKGNEAVKAGRLEDAVMHYSSGLAASSEADVESVTLLRSNRSLCFHKLGRQEEAVEDAKLCVALKPDFVKGYLRGALALKAMGQPAEAMAFLKRCPANDEASNLVAELRPAAEEAERKRIESLSGPEKCKEEGNALFRKGLFEKALEKYSEALHSCDDQNSEIALALRNNRAACYHQLSDFSSVAKDACFVLEREPNNLKALARRMLAYEPLEKYEAALADARAVLRQDPRHEAANKVQHRLGKLVRDLQRCGA